MKKYIIFSLLMAICFGAAAQEQRYAVKSGIITMEMDMMGQAIVQEIYFDDYGATGYRHEYERSEDQKHRCRRQDRHGQ